MNINFFEEYPTEENLKIVSTLTWPATIFLAANSFAEYKKNEKIVKNLNPIIETAFWPILEKSYWVSPFSDIKDLEKLENDILLIEKGTTVLLDLELPLFKKGSLYYKNFFNFIKNKRKIKKILKIANEKGVQIVTAEYPRYFFGFDLFYKILDYLEKIYYLNKKFK